MNGPNKRNHIFANPDHNLDALVQHYGSEEEAYRAIVDTVNRAQQDGKLSTNRRGLYEQVFDVGGYPVMVRGRIVNGLVRIGTAWIPPHPWGWSVELPTLTKAPRRLVDSVFLPPWEHGDDNA
jgi:hypothetical protein